MARFDYLDDKKRKDPKKSKKSKSPAPKSAAKLKKARKSAPAPDGRTPGDAAQAEAVYLRKETIRAAWREYRAGGGESLSELVEDLLLRWLRERA